MVKQEAEVSLFAYEALRDAVAGPAPAVRTVVKLAPAGGPGDKVFPATYQGGQYARERRRVGDEVVDAVLLDSVQSQANRMEQALKQARERKELRFPLIVADFTANLPDVGQITALDAPHRVADAIFRESLLDGKHFRDSPAGQRFVAARTTNATALFELCPTALVFGVWDSTGLGPRAGLGAKFQRALVSEIVGFDAEVGVRSASRIDPLPISSQVDIYQVATGDGWTIDPDRAATDAKGKPIPFRGQEGRGRPSAINLGNVTPDIARDRRTREVVPGGATISYALQTTVLSLAALRRLSFPLPGGERSAEVDTAARTVLAALALAAIAYQRAEGFDLRSRCLLVPVEQPVYELIPGDGGAPAPFSLDLDQAKRIFASAVEDARAAGLPWSEDDILLEPSERLLGLIQRSLEVGLPVEGEELPAPEEK